MRLRYVFSEMPYVMALHSDYLDKRCALCATTMPAKGNCRIECNQGCNMAAYCSETCQRSDQPSHQPECVAYRQGKMPEGGEISTLAARLLGRLASRYKHDYGVVMLSTDFPSHMFKDRCFDDLMTHEKDLNNSWCHQYNFKEAKTAFYKFFKDTPIGSIPEKELKRFFYRLSINGFSLNNRSKVHPEMIEEVGESLYLNASRFNHSCRPSGLYKFDGGRIVIQHIDESGQPDDDQDTTPLTKEQFENLTLQYGYGSYWNYAATCPLTKQRIESLKARYFFRCRCELCDDPIRDKIQLNSAPVECDQCKSPLVWQRSLPFGSFKLKKTCPCSKKKLSDEERNKTTVFPQGSSRQVKKLSRQWKRVMEASMNTSKLERAVSLCASIAGTAEQYWHPTYNLRLGQIYEKLFCSLCEMKFDDHRRFFNGNEEDLDVMLHVGEVLMRVYLTYHEVYMTSVASYAKDIAALYKLRSDTERSSFWYQFAIDMWKQRGEMECAKMIERVARGPPPEWKQEV